MSLDRAGKKITAVVVTGGSSGIGKCFIEQLYQLNPEIWFCNLSRSDPGDFSAKSLKLKHFPCDLSSPQALSEVFPALEAFLEDKCDQGEILLINNSGFGCYGPAQELDFDNQLNLLDLNIRALVKLTGLMLPRLMRQGGVVIDVASTSAFQPTPQLAAYGASKAFVLHWNLALGDDLKGTKVRTFCLCPGPTATQFFKRAGFENSPVPNYGQNVDEVVSAALKAMFKGKRMLVTGAFNKFAAAAGSHLLSKQAVTAIAGWVLRKVRQP